MAVTAATPLALAQSLLNDAAGTSYTTASLIPLMQKAYRELQIKMEKAGLGVTKEVSASITLPAGTLRLADGALLPNDFLYPVNIFERGSTSERWAEVVPVNWEPTETAGVALRYYAWREEEIRFIGSTTDRLLLLQYKKGLTAITLTSTGLQINDCDQFLAARTAAIAAVVIGENPTRGEILNMDAESLWQDLKGTRVKGTQGMPVRRRTTRYRQ